MLRGFFGNLIFAIIARMLCGSHLNQDPSKLYLTKKKATKKEGKTASVGRKTRRYVAEMYFIT